MSYSRDISQPIFDRALNVLVKGVSSNFRFLGEKETPVIVKGKGAHVWDADDNAFIDYRLGWGPIILGHADDRVNHAVAEHLENGTTFAATSELEVIVAEKLVKMIPGMEKLRFTNTGTEATMHALRTARGYTNKEKFIKFEGQYHGAHDYVLFSTASSPISAMGARTSPIPVQVGSGIPDKIRDYVFCLPFNDFAAIEQCVKDHHGEVAAVLVEPCLGNIAGIEPKDGFLDHLRSLCSDHNIVLIFDEVKTGFRLSNGGARDTYGVIPDISTYAKSLGNGLPVAAFGGKAQIMDVIGGGSVTHAGTFGANGVSMAAANAVIDILNETPVLKELANRGLKLKNGLDQILTDADLPHQMCGHPNIQGFLITEKEVHEVRDLAHSDDVLYEEIMNNMYDRGIWVESDPREPWFLCEAHTDDIIDKTLNIFQESVKAAVK
jgi:glutamate-1-semialdehyde 2,1-aminomutase|tara:strand:+ start:3161 stop:4471 length:1311 start_codon:yes stop_codon:yes gene_type:complete